MALFGCQKLCVSFGQNCIEGDYIGIKHDQYYGRPLGFVEKS